MKKTKEPEQSQRERFEQAARELGCDESEERFDETLKRVAKHKPKDVEGQADRPPLKLSSKDTGRKA